MFKNILTKILKNKHLLIVGLTLIIITSFKLYAASQIGILGDEPDDFANIALDNAAVKNFYNDISSAEQSRLPHNISLPFILLSNNHQVFAARFISILVFTGFLLVFYFLLRLHLNKPRALFGFLLASFSSYMFSFSVFAMTTSNSLYLLFSTLALYLYLKQRKEKTINQSWQIAYLGVIFGLAMASKLFGVILFFIVLIFDFIKYKRWQNIIDIKETKKLFASNQGVLIIIFFLFWLLINFVPILPIYKLILLSPLLLLTLGGFIYFAIKEKLKLNSMIQWVYCLAISGMVLIVASPIYLNIKNVINIFDWTENWNGVAGITINPTFWDPFLTIGIKFGIVSGIFLVATIIALVATKQFKKMVSDYGLLFIVFGSFLTIFFAVTNFIMWYPLVIFWILYIPFCYVIPENPSRKPIDAVVIVILLAIPSYEVFRYAKLFPYSHTDGAQYGSQYVGWNKPGFITFDAMPMLKDYVYENYNSLEYTTADCALLPRTIERYNKYAVENFNYYLEQKGIYNFECVNVNKAERDLVITSNYTEQDFVDSLYDDYSAEEEFYINTVKTVTVWKKKQ